MCHRYSPPANNAIKDVPNFDIGVNEKKLASTSIFHTTVYWAE